MENFARKTFYIVMVSRQSFRPFPFQCPFHKINVSQIYYRHLLLHNLQTTSFFSRRQMITLRAISHFLQEIATEFLKNSLLNLFFPFGF